MKQIFATILLMGLASPAFGLSASIGGSTDIGGGGIDIGGGVVSTNACGCDWSDADYTPDGVESTCMECSEKTS